MMVNKKEGDKMRNYQKVAELVLPLLLVAVQAYATIETSGVGVEVPGKTLADFQKEYSGTKPIVAWHKYQEYRRLQNAPRPTLEASRMRTEPLVYDEFSGTKPIVRFINQNRPKAKTTEHVYVAPAPDSGTKPVVAFLRKRS